MFGIVLQKKKYGEVSEDTTPYKNKYYLPKSSANCFINASQAVTKPLPI